MSPATAVPFRFPQPARANQSGLCLEHHPSPSHNLLRHGDPFHRCLSGILAWRSILLTGFRHGDPAHRYFRDIPACRRGLLSTLWHGNPFHRCLSGILARRSVLLTGLRHGDPFHRYLSGITAWRDRHQSHVPPARDNHRASEYAVHLAVMAFGLLGVLLEGSLGNRHRQPTPASTTQNRPMTGLHPSSDCSSARFKALSCPLLIRGKCIFFIFGTICYISP